MLFPLLQEPLGSIAGSRPSNDSDGLASRQKRYAEARRRYIEGRSKMIKKQLENALGVR